MDENEVVEVTDELFGEIQDAYLHGEIIFEQWLTETFDLPSPNESDYNFGLERMGLIVQPTRQKTVERILGVFVSVVPGLVLLRGLSKPDRDIASLIVSDNQNCLFASKPLCSKSFHFSISGNIPTFLDRSQFSGFPVIVHVTYSRDEGDTYGITEARWNVMEPWLDKYLPPKEEA